MTQAEVMSRHRPTEHTDHDDGADEDVVMVMLMVTCITHTHTEESAL